MNAILHVDPANSKGMIVPDSEKGRAFGFTSDRFDGYLWESGKRVMTSFIESLQQGQGHLSELFRNIEAAGYYVAVPTPLPRMEAILKRKGFIPHTETSELGDPVEVWMKPHPTKNVYEVYARGASTIHAQTIVVHQEAKPEAKDKILAAAQARREQRSARRLASSK